MTAGDHPRIPAWAFCVGALILLLPSTSAQPADTLYWEGSVTLDDAFHVAEGTTLVVAPGTVVHGQGPVVVHGAIQVQGTPDEPVQWMPVLIVDHDGQEVSNLHNAQVTGHGIDEPCKVQLEQGSLGIYDSRFENNTRAVCTAGNTHLEMSSNYILRNGFALYPNPIGPVAVVECSTETNPETCHQHTTSGPDETIGGRSSCWPQPGGGWACRGWGGTRAVVIGTGASAALYNNTFYQNYVGVMTGIGDIQIYGNTFRDNDRGIQVWAQEEKPSEGSFPRDSLLIQDNLFVDHGDPNHVAPGVPSWIGLAVGGDFGDNVKPDPDDIRILVTHNTFRNGSKGIHVEGWRPTLGVVENQFEGNAIGFSAYTASAILLNNTFQGGTWDVYLGGVTGYVTLRGGIIDPQKIYVGDGQTLDSDWGLIVGTTTAAAIILLIALTEPGRYLLALLVVPLTNRVRDKQGLLDHPRRQRILEFVQNYPGTYLRAIGEALVIPRNPTTYHVQILERAGLIHSRRHGLHRRVYPAGHNATTPEPSPRERILDLVESRPGIQQAQAARQLGISPQLLSHHVKGLEEAGMVQRQQDGMRKALFPV